MTTYMFELALPEFSEEILRQIPAHRETINSLFTEGKLLSYSVAQDRSKIWCVVSADNREEAMEIVGILPLQEFFTGVECIPLLFHNVVPASLPGISLN